MDIAQFNAGYFEQQFQYKSFVPALINQEWVISDPAILTLLTNASRLLGELNAFAQLIPDVDFFIQMHITKEATTSSRIEGTQTNMEEALIGEQDIDPERRDDWQEVHNYIEAVNYAIAQLATMPLSNRLLRRTHQILLQGVRGKHKLPGEFRNSQNWIGPSLKHAIFVPPHPSRVPELMGDLEQFSHNDAIYVPHLVRIALIHYQFETIHPFLDGNGRLGRLLVPLYLAHANVLTKPALYLSDFFEQHKGDYYDHLMAVRTNHQLAAWVRFFLVGVEESAEKSIQTFKAILTLKEQIEHEKLPQLHARKQANARQLVRALYQRPIMDINQISDLLAIRHNTATALVKDFVALNLLEELTGHQRNRLYAFAPYIRLFRE